jgi:hypothetical protein
MTTSTSTKTRIADSTDRLAAIPSTKTTPAQAKAPTTRFGAARRLLTTLMRSLASPHV